MTTIPLNRQFYEWKEKTDELALLRYRAAAGLSNGLLGWPELLVRRRVVILAEAGSGKTEELVEQARQQTAAGRFAVYATVQDVGRYGLDKALRLVDRQRLNAWRVGNEPGWFFIDSIDEAKLDNIRLEKALRQIAEGIAGGESRAHIVLSGRHTDWEFARDAQRLNDELPLPHNNLVEPLPSLETLVRRILRHEKRPEPMPVETALIVVMAQLDREQVRTYAAAKNARKLDGLMAAIEAASLWGFARRPLDLDWIVRYWQRHDRLGSFTVMIEVSLRERLQETDPERGRRDSLDAERAKHGLERIGAALVFGRQTTIAIPDNDARTETERTVAKIEDVLPDWSSEDRMKLLLRPAFDPATFGRARLHNDNEGVVRAYLAARWLQRLRQCNLPQRQLHNLLFSRIYEVDLVKPSMLETAAWLALWDESVASEVVRRAPFVLFTAGDPASLSHETRQALLTALVERMRRDEEVPLLDLSSLARFVLPDIVPALRAVWATDKEHDEIRHFVLRLIWLGKVKDCADLAIEASFGRYQDFSTAMTAGRALLAAGDAGVRREYAEYIKVQCAVIPPTLVWEAVDDLFPQLIDVDDLLAILAVIHLGDAEGGGFRFDWNGAELVERLKSPPDLTRLINGLLQQLEAESQVGTVKKSPRDEQYAAALGAAALRLLDLSPDDVAPTAAIDAALRISDRRQNMIQRRISSASDVVERLHRTAERRRAAFWRAAERLRNYRSSVDYPLLYLFQMQLLGWPLKLVLDDIDWLLIDGPSRGRATERKLAINSALNIWSAEGKPEALKRRISDVATTDLEMQETYTEWMTPHTKSAEEIKSDEDLAEARRAGELAQAEQEQSWIDFIADLKENPVQLRRLHPTTETSIDRRIYCLWQLLSEASSNNSCYAINSVEPLVELAGEEVAAAFAAGLAEIWRAWKPTLRSVRPAEERNQISTIDCLGIAGISIEAAIRKDWALCLTEPEAIRAAEYATLEINGIPDWIAALVAAWPAAVEKVFVQEVVHSLDDPTPLGYYQLLDALRRSDESVVQLMAPSLLSELEARSNLDREALRLLLFILNRGLLRDKKKDLCALALSRFQFSSDPHVSAQYLEVAYAINAYRATDALMAKLDLLGEVEKTALVQQALPQIFGSRWPLSELADMHLDAAVLERLVLLAYAMIPLEDNRNRVTGGVYSQDECDEVKRARSAAFSALVNTPGHATYAAILRLMDTPNFPVPRSRLLALALARAANDAEHTAWRADDPFQFEQGFEKPPVTGRELQRVVLQRLEDLQHDLVHGDFQQGTTLCALPDEQEVQKWVADRLRQVQGAAYSIEREVHVADEKEPDLRLRAKASDVTVATEIKVAESWSMKELEDALVIQLCGQYLRGQEGREGILLLVHQKTRSKGWKLPDGAYLDFEGVVQRLRALAVSIRSKSPAGPQPEIGVIDVSRCDDRP
ncbi:hypothetical protein [Chromobacterium sp. IIBBL 290-4]|uniref:hypothetical protein n=1 Tax=Chromobacterium sp. IIBBL 290-4 TaxID=2953890 RepID=UPI0020B812B2|nr:hypothetical protein [Chromobacterium sp. IIBBL 290-4]UTH74432.1 hypothetical protein NKT35_23370 [Chromobacterium sp. IIBBL 290-4]